MSQQDSQTLTGSLYCKFTGTVHLIKRQPCVSMMYKDGIFWQFQAWQQASTWPKLHVWNAAGMQWSLICSSHHAAPQYFLLPECGPCPESSCQAGKLEWSGWYPRDWPPGFASWSPRTAPPAAPPNPRRHCTLQILMIRLLTQMVLLLRKN